MSEQQGQNLANLMGMGGTAEAAGNDPEAISYYNRVLEADPTFSAAWFGKGRAAGRLSTLAHLRVTETIVAFGHAIATAADGEKEAVAKQASVELTTLVTVLYEMAKQHRDEHSMAPGARKTYLAVAAQLHDALANGRSWQPLYEPSLKLTVRIAKDLLWSGVSEELAAILRQRKDEAEETLAAIDPTYRRPVPVGPMADPAQVKKNERTFYIWSAIAIGLILVTLIALAGFHSGDGNRAPAIVENNGDALAEMMEQQADNLDALADNTSAPVR